MLAKAKESYDALSGFRKKRNRCLDYTFGRQWRDIVTDSHGRNVTEYEYILSEGNVPLQNNLIRRIVRNVLGVFRQRLPEIMKNHYGAELKAIAEVNSLAELFSRTMEEFMISGMAVHRKRVGLRSGRPGVWTEIVSPGSFFFNTDSRDARGWDINLIGQVHKVNFTDWCSAFVRTPADYKEAVKLYDKAGRCLNITEVWCREPVPRMMVHDCETGYVRMVNEEEGERLRAKGWPVKWMIDEVWRYHFLSDDGIEIAGGDSPYAHGSHPYILKCYPYLDGEIHSFVGDLIDQQRYTNRLITMYDWVIRASAKGVLLLPEGSVDYDDIQGVADQWSRFNGVIVYRADPNRPAPQQVSGNLSNLGISELLEIQLKMLEDVSGVNGILQGNTSGGNVSGTLYKSQTTNAMYSLADLIQTFETFIADSASADRCLMAHTDEPF